MLKTKHIGIVGIHTGVGKTYISMLLTNILKADYWKPLQAGTEPFTDSEFVQQNIRDQSSVVHPEFLVLQTAASPHTALKNEHQTIDFDKLQLPSTTNPYLIIETAGGIFSPLTETTSQLTLLKHLEIKNVIVVINQYLGSINHSMLTIQILQQNGFNILGLVLNNITDKDTEDYIVSNSKTECLMKVKFNETNMSTDTKHHIQQIINHAYIN